MKKGAPVQLELLKPDAPEGDGVPDNWRPVLAHCLRWRRKPRQLKLPLGQGQLVLFDAD